MAYKRYIRRNGRLYGPYVYKSIRDKDGRVRNIYVGTASDSSHGKRFTLQAYHKGLIAAIIFLSIAASWFFFISPTGLVIQEETITQSVSIDASFNETTEMGISLEGEPQYISVTGRIEGNGTVRIYAVSDDRTFIIYSNGNADVPEGSPVTGMVTGETAEPESPVAVVDEAAAGEPAQPPAGGAASTEEPPQASETSPAEAAPAATSEPQAEEPVPAGAAETPLAVSGEETTPVAETPLDENQTAEEPAVIPEENVSGTEGGATGPIANVTLPEEPAENGTIIEEPSGTADNGTVETEPPEANATEGQQPPVVILITEFEDSCMETCAISAFGRQITIVVDVEPGTVVYINEIRYAYKVEVNATAEQQPLSISIESPANESYGGAPVQFVVRTSIDSDWCTFSLDGSEDTEMAGVDSTTFEHPVYDIMPGSHYAVFRCSDPYGNVTQSDTVYFSLTSPRITITIVEPSGDVDAAKNEPFPVTVEVTCSDADCGDVEVALDPYETGGDGQ